MRLEHMSCRHVCRAIDIYLERAWGTAPSGPVSDLVTGVRAVSGSLAPP